MSKPVLEAQGVRKEYFRKGRESARNFDAVPRTDIVLERGALVVLKGRSGSGKTTLLNMLAGLLEPTEGSVLFEGDDLYALDDAALSRLRNLHFGVIPQGQTPLYSLTVEQNVMLAQTMYEARDKDLERAADLLGRLGIEGLADAMPAELSGGELRRMAIARALIGKPSIIVADEPTGDLDDHNTQVVMDLLREEADRGAAVVMATHEQFAESFADEVIQMQSL